MTRSGRVGGVVVFALSWSIAAIPRLSSAVETTPIEAGRLYLTAGVVDTATLPNQLHAGLAAFDGRTVYVLQLDEPITPALRGELEKAGAKLGDYLPAYAYIADLSMANPAVLAALPGVRWVGEFQDAWRLSPDIGRRFFQDGIPYESEFRQNLAAAGRVLVEMTLFAGRTSDATVRDLAAIPGATVDGLAEVGGQAMVSVSLNRQDVPRLAALKDVQYAEEAPEATLRNGTTRWIIQSNTLNLTPVYANGLTGTGQIVGIIDSNVDVAHCSFVHAGVPIGPLHRKVQAYNGTPGLGSHGTHVAGTVVGNALPTTGTFTDNTGIAYDGKFVWAGNSGSMNINSGTTLNSTFEYASANGADMHTNSWGADFRTDYNNWSRQIDVFTYNNEDDVVLFAITNQSVLYTPENAKNVLAVGASDDTPNQANHCSGGAGPTEDGRRKPEVYAPGCSTVSSNDGTACSTTALTGTSMACPAVAGAAMLARQYFVDGFYPFGFASPAADFTNPSGALVRAVLMNSSVDMTGITGYPSNLEGWGRLRLDDALFFPGDARRLAVLDDVRNAQGLSTGGLANYTLNVTSSSPQLRVTLVWTEPPAALNSTQPVINNLDLEVVSPGGTLYRGNVFTGGVSVSGGTADTLNNCEQVHLNSPPTGAWTVRVRGTAVNQGAQGYALIATGDVAAELPPLAITLPNGAPDLLAPATPTNFDVLIVPGDENIVPGSPTLHYRLSPGAFSTVPLAHISGNLYQATLPGVGCEDLPEFYVSAQGDGGGSAVFPAGAPSTVLSASVGVLEVPFNDNFETNQGWSVVDVPSGAQVFRGTWQRGVPAGGGDRGDPPGDFDGSGQCYATELADGDTDVDNGETLLTSPVINLANLQIAQISYARWYNNVAGSAPQEDTMTIQVSSNAGLSWTNLEVIGPTTASPIPNVQGGWFYVTYNIADFVPITNQFRIRFRASDVASGSVVEAAVDAVRIESFFCEDGTQVPAAPTGLAAADGDDCGAIALSWSAVAGADDYEVWRNTTNNSATATRIAFDLAAASYQDAAVAPATTYFYWVTACNSAGCSGFSAADSGFVRIKGDFDGNGVVDGRDLQGFVDAFLLPPQYDACADLAAPAGSLDDGDVTQFIDELLGA